VIDDFQRIGIWAAINFATESIMAVYIRPTQMELYIGNNIIMLC